jgi:hypothetical protein
MVQTAEDRRSGHLGLFRKAMSGGNQLIGVRKRLWNARSQAGVWTTSIVVGHIRSSPQVGFSYAIRTMQTQLRRVLAKVTIPAVQNSHLFCSTISIANSIKLDNGCHRGLFHGFGVR